MLLHSRADDNLTCYLIQGVPGFWDMGQAPSQIKMIFILLVGMVIIPESPVSVTWRSVPTLGKFEGVAGNCEEYLLG